MKAPAVLLSLALATTVAAQGNPELPKCAQSCVDQYLRGGIGNCGSDPKCICENSGFIDSIACCLAGVCDPPAQTQAVGFAASLCGAFGVTTLPTAVVCSTAKGGASQTKTTVAKTTATTTAGGSGATAPAGNSSGSSGAAPTPSPTGSGASDDTDSAAQTSSSSTQSSNLGPRPTAAAGLGAIGGLVAALALL